MLLAFLPVAATLYAQQDTTEKNLDEVLVYSNKFAEKKKNFAQKIDVITARAIARYNGQNTGDLLINTGNVFVQKSQQGGSSPVLRGFEASRVLLVVDGIRMNNAIYRGGHLQNVITVDQNMLDQVEVLYGPASTIYGSDALGGVLHFRTKAPKLSSDGNLFSTGSVFSRYSTVNEEKSFHADLSLGGQKFAWLQSYTYSDFGDMKMGKTYPDKYPDFGRRSTYIETVNGIDQIVQNSDDRIQRFSGYSQWDITQKLLLKSSDKVSHLLNLQYSNSSNVPRYDRLQDVKNFGGSTGTALRYAKWYYGPQTRLMGAYELSIGKTGLFDDVKLNLNYQDIKESRVTREYKRYDRLDSRREHVKVAGAVLDGHKKWGSNDLNIGMDAQWNDVRSVADRTNLNTGAVTKLDTRYPDGKNRMLYIGLYSQHLVKFKGNDKWILNDGIRFQLVHLHSTIVDNSFFNFPFNDITQNPFAITWNVGTVYTPSPKLRFNANLSSGFRAPNVDDVARIFESSTASGRLIIPNPEIKPEYTYNLDLGVTQQIEDKLHVEFGVFYTLFRNAITPAPSQFMGQSTILYNGTQVAVYANRNVNKAFAYGFNGRLKIDLSKSASWDNTVTYTYGRFKKDDGTKKPLDHVPPVFGKSSLTFSGKSLGFEMYVIYNGWKKIADYNPDGEDNGQYATADGMPSWFTANWRASYKFNKVLTLQAGIENLFDRNYRYFASGFSAPGLNCLVALRANW